ncbi:HAMP domain-containing sensor histidine kinase [Blastococcus sp. CT_GayMR16]|uniref:sensor histidine kinase n=1 Tax=Blastococcus sp. CT_GayMR16 TaxID=2559607 RepID=UPI0010749431|nr:HAMP domain-containing sensor histidine kinase [Blastococcus sp. CT_GayMR16]TFV89913.1 HAMP domain-containing histidine kinase [Blastococcus sp. CT_GayMR16]
MTRRIVTTVLVVCTLAVALFFVPMALLVRDQYRHTDLLELQRLNFVAVRHVPDTAADRARWTPADTNPDHRYALYDSSGRRITGNGPVTADAAITEALRGDVAGGATDDEIVAATPLGSGARPTGALRIAEPREESTARTATAIAWMSALAVAAILFAAGAGWWLVRRLLGPVQALRAAADRLGRGDFTVEVPTTALQEIDDVGRALAASGARIGRLVERERAFSADASHELRTPVAAVLVALETELLAPRPDRRTVLVESIAALTRLETTIEDLLRLARDNPGDREPADICALANDIGTDWLPRYDAARRPLQVSCQNAPAVPVSATAVRHILDVLLDNALRHGDGAVSLAADATPGGVAITVTDQGPGPRQPETLFTRRDPRAAGTGVGLALARSLAEAEGARLRLRAAAPTTFELLIPLRPQGGTTEPSPDRPDQARPTSGRTPAGQEKNA